MKPYTEELFHQEVATKLQEVATEIKQNLLNGAQLWTQKKQILLAESQILKLKAELGY